MWDVSRCFRLPLAWAAASRRLHACPHPAAAEAAAARRRAAAMCQISGVGEVGAEEPHPAAMQAAMNEVRSGAAFRDSPYADGVADLVRPQQGGS